MILVANHQTYADPPLMTIPVRRSIHYMAWNRLFDVPLFGALIRCLRAFPVDIEAKDTRAAREMIHLLKAGEAVMVFPEGGRSPDGRVAPFKSGAFRVAASFFVPILPVTIVGGHEAWPPQRSLPRRGRITITYHPLLHPDRGLAVRERARVLAERTRIAILSAIPEARRVG